MTPDIEKLRKAQKLAQVLEDLEFEFVDDPAWDQPSDTSYLSAEEEKDPDIASNVEAMNATNKLIAWFGDGQMGFVGLWRGPEGLPLDKAPVVVLDSEGQYEIAATTVADFIVISVDEDDVKSTVKALIDAGFSPRQSHEADLEDLQRFQRCRSQRPPAQALQRSPPEAGVGASGELKGQ